MSNAPFGLLPNLVRRSVIVREPIGVVRILVGVKIQIRMLGGKFASRTDRAIGTLARIGINDVGAVSVQNLLALNRNIRRHAKRNREALSRTQHGVSYPGIAAGRIKQSLSRG